MQPQSGIYIHANGNNINPHLKGKQDTHRKNLDAAKSA